MFCGIGSSRAPVCGGVGQEPGPHPEYSAGTCLAPVSGVLGHPSAGDWGSGPAEA